MTVKHIRELREAAGESLGIKNFNSGKASEIVHSKKSWYKWETGETKMPLALLELFCIKTGLEFDPELLEGKVSPRKGRKKTLESEVKRLEAELEALEEQRIKEKEELINTFKGIKKLI